MTPEEMFGRDLKGLEGDSYHVDTQGIPTLPYGVALHVPSNKQWADSERVKHGAGRYEDIPKEVVKEYAVGLFKKADEAASRSIPDYDQLTARERYLVAGAKYNTGDNFPTLTKELIKLRKKEEGSSLLNVFKNTRRKEGNINTKGMDNRALKELINSGLFDPYDEKQRAVAKQALPLGKLSNINSKYTDF